MQSRKILALIKESLPVNLQKVEKASIDEVVRSLHENELIMLSKLTYLTNFFVCQSFSTCRPKSIPSC